MLTKLGTASTRLAPVALGLVVYSVIDAPAWAYAILAVFAAIIIAAAAVTWNDTTPAAAH